MLVPFIRHKANTKRKRVVPIPRAVAMGGLGERGSLCTGSCCCPFLSKEGPRDRVGHASTGAAALSPSEGGRGRDCTSEPFTHGCLPKDCERAQHAICASVLARTLVPMLAGAEGRAGEAKQGLDTARARKPGVGRRMDWRPAGTRHC